MPYNHKAENNPFWGHQHKEESKKKISDSQRLRLSKICTLVKNLSEAKFDARVRKIVHEELLKRGCIKE